jgi:hypothetical protein
MFKHMARKRGLVSLAPVALFALVATGCVSAAPGAGAAGTSGGYNVQDRMEGHSTVVTTKAPIKSRGTWQVGLTGTHAGGGGPQR